VPPWALPLIVLAVTTPILVAWLTVGPSFGLLMAGLVGQAVVLTAIRLSSQPPRRRSRRRKRAAAATRRPRQQQRLTRGLSWPAQHR
jgi:L-lactate permease